MKDIATGKYQLLDQLSPDDFDALEADILDRGCLVAVEFDEEGNVLDGHHRKMICEKHDLPYPKIIRKGWTEEQKRTHARRMNLARRQLTRAQRRKLVEDELRDSPGSTNRKIGASLGVDHKTVGTVRKAMEEGGEIPQVDVAVGRDGKPYTRKPVGRSVAPKGTNEEVVFDYDREFNWMFDTIRDRIDRWPEDHRTALSQILGQLSKEALTVVDRTPPRHDAGG